SVDSTAASSSSVRARTAASRSVTVSYRFSSATPHTSEASRRRRGEWSTRAAIVKRSQRLRSTGRCTAWAMVPAPITAMFRVFGIERLLGLGGGRRQLRGDPAGAGPTPASRHGTARDARLFYHTHPV